MSAPPELTVFQYPGLSRGATMSPPCGKVLMALRFKGLEFTIRNLRTPAQVRRVNARGRVPALQIGERLVVDSSDVLDALEEAFPEPPLDPVDPHDALRARFWEDWADECLYFYAVWLRWIPDPHFDALKARLFQRVKPPLRWLLPGIARRLVRRRLAAQGTGAKPPEVIWREFRERLDGLEALLSESDFLVGGALTRADLAVISVLDQLVSETIPPGLTQELAARPALRAWRERIHAQAPCAAGYASRTALLIMGPS